MSDLKSSRGVEFLTIHRNSISGEICSAEFVKKHPKITTTERRIDIKKTLTRFLRYVRVTEQLLKDDEIVEEFLKP